MQQERSPAAARDADAKLSLQDESYHGAGGELEDEEEEEQQRFFWPEAGRLTQDVGTVTEEVWENERWGIDRQGRSRFGPEFLYPVERSHFEPCSRRVLGVIFEACSESRKRNASVRTVDDEFWDGAALPAEQEWTGAWKVDTTRSRDPEGWLYGVNFVRDAGRRLSAQYLPHHFVRTRRWVRTRRLHRDGDMTFVEDDDVDDDENYSASAADYFLSSNGSTRPDDFIGKIPARQMMWTEAGWAIAEQAKFEFWAALIAYPCLVVATISFCCSTSACRKTVLSGILLITVWFTSRWLTFGIARRLRTGLGCWVDVTAVEFSINDFGHLVMEIRDVSIGDPATSSPILAIERLEASMRFVNLCYYLASLGYSTCRFETMACSGVEVTVEAVDEDRINCDLLAASTNFGRVERKSTEDKDDDVADDSAVRRMGNTTTTLPGLEALGLRESVKRAGEFVAQCEAASNRLSLVELVPSLGLTSHKAEYSAKEARAERWKIRVGASAWAAVLRGSLVADLEAEVRASSVTIGGAWRRSVVERLLEKIDDFCFELEVDRVTEVSREYESATTLCTVLGQELREMAARRVVEKLASEAKLVLERLFAASDENHQNRSWLEQIIVAPLAGSNSKTIAKIRKSLESSEGGKSAIDEDLIDRFLDETPLGSAVASLGVTLGARRALAAGLAGSLKFAFDNEKSSSNATKAAKKSDQAVRRQESEKTLVQFTSLASTTVDALMPLLRAVRQTLEIEWRYRAPQALASLDAAVVELDGIRRDAAAASEAARQLCEKGDRSKDDDEEGVESISLLSSVLRSTDTDRLLAVCSRIADVVSCLDKVARQDTVEKVAQTLATHADAHVVAALTEKALDLFLKAFRALPAGAFRGEAITPLLGVVEYGIEQIDLSAVHITRDQIEITLLEFEGGTTVRDLAYFVRGQACTTPYGPGTVTKYDAFNRMYQVTLSFGTATLRPECVVRREEKPWYPTARYLDPIVPHIYHHRNTKDIMIQQQLDLATAAAAAASSSALNNAKNVSATSPSDGKIRKSSSSSGWDGHYPRRQQQHTTSLHEKLSAQLPTKRKTVDGLVSIRLNDLEAPLSGLSWTYRQESWPYASDSGVADAILDGLGAVITLAARRKRTTGTVYFCISQIEVNLNKVHVRVRQSKIAGIYNALASTLSTPLKDYVATSLETALKLEARVRLKPANDYLEHNHLWPLLGALSKIKESDIPFDDDVDASSNEMAARAVLKERASVDIRTQRRRLLPPEFASRAESSRMTVPSNSTTVSSQSTGYQPAETARFVPPLRRTNFVPSPPVHSAYTSSREELFRQPSKALKKDETSTTPLDSRGDNLVSSDPASRDLSSTIPRLRSEQASHFAAAHRPILLSSRSYPPPPKG